MERWKRSLMIMVLALSLSFTSNLVAEEKEGMEEGGEEVEAMETDLSKLPEIILTAAEGAIENIVITGFRQENELGQLTYEVEGLVEETCYEIEECD